MSCNRPAFANLVAFRALPVTALTSYADTAPADTDAAPAELPRYWQGIIGAEGVLTGDGRLLENGSLEWDTPAPFRIVKEDVGGHLGAVSAGRILSITREDDGKLRAYGDFDHGSDDGKEAARLVRDGVMRGVSMDLDSVDFEIRVAAEVAEAEDAFWEALENDEELPEPERETDDEGRVTVVSVKSDDEVFVTTSGRVRAATLVSIPAFAEAVIEPADSLPEEIMALVASAAPVDPPAGWFSTPEPDAVVALTITDEGHVYGHLASWEQCHIADPNGSGVCVMAPKSNTDYSYFHTGVVKTDEGSLVTTGVLRFNTQHASLRASADSAAAHYDHTGLAGADIHAINGKHGVWISGALRPGLSAEQVRTLRASPLSGDWRYVGGSLELVGALAVNLPGFPIPRTRGLVASGELTGLVAAGMIAPPAAATTDWASKLSRSDADYLRRIIHRERTSELRSMRARVNATVNRRKVADMARRLSRDGKLTGTLATTTF